MVDCVVAGVLAAPGAMERMLGADHAPLTEIAVEIVDHAMHLCEPGKHPALVATPGARTKAILLQGLSEADLARVGFYEESFGRQAQSVTVILPDGSQTNVPSWVAPVESVVENVACDFDAWWTTWQVVALHMAENLCAFYGRKPAAEMGKSLYSMRIRAAAWRDAQAQPLDPERDLARDVVVHAHRREYINFFAMEEMDLQFRRFDGSLSPVMNRGAALVGAASVLLPYDVARDAVLLIEQFRAPLFMVGDRHPWLWEPPAGLIDPGETPSEAALREAKEEAGLTVSHLEEVGSLYPSSGASGEYIHIFCGLTDFSSIVGGGGVPSEGEDIRSKVISFHELMDGVDKRTFRDMPLVTAALWLARHRDRLRAEFG